jgi:hypothetical protein
MKYYLKGILLGVAVIFAAMIFTRAESQVHSTTVVSLEGNAWRVASDPQNIGREQSWWKGPAADARPMRVPGILQEALPGYHGVAWYCSN